MCPPCWTRMVLAQRVPRSASRVRKLWAGRSSRLLAAWWRASGEHAGGPTFSRRVLDRLAGTECCCDVVAVVRHAVISARRRSQPAGFRFRQAAVWASSAASATPSALAAATAAVETAPTATPAESAASTSWQPGAVCLGQ